MTPIHVRGKRNVNHPSEPKKKRPRSMKEQGTMKGRVHQTSPAQSNKARIVRVSKLEDLPTEVLEVIFLYSENPNLPLVSPRLSSQLTSERLQKQMLRTVLAPFYTNDELSTPQIHAIESMLSRRCCTWKLFCEWLLYLAELRDLGPDLQYRRIAEACCEAYYDEYYPFSTKCTPQFRLPSKLLHGPWTDDKHQFLDCCISLLHIAFTRLEYANKRHLPNAEERARISSFDGIQDAIQEHAMLPLRALLSIGAEVYPQHVHSAVLDFGCDEVVVRELLNNITTLAFDPLDPMLWAWADQPAQYDSGQGIWLKQQLRDVAARPTSKTLRARQPSESEDEV